jgi:hypothetical protein
MPRKSFLWITLLMTLLPGAIFSQNTRLTLVSAATMDSLVAAQLIQVDSLLARQANDAGYTIMNDRDTKFLYYLGRQRPPYNEFVLFDRGSPVGAFCEGYLRVDKNGHTQSVLRYRLPSPKTYSEDIFVQGKIRRYNGEVESLELLSPKQRNFVIYRKGGPLIIRTDGERLVYLPSLAD